MCNKPISWNFTRNIIVRFMLASLHFKIQVSICLSIGFFEIIVKCNVENSYVVPHSALFDLNDLISDNMHSPNQTEYNMDSGIFSQKRILNDTHLSSGCMKHNGWKISIVIVTMISNTCL